MDMASTIDSSFLSVSYVTKEDQAFDRFLSLTIFAFVHNRRLANAVQDALRNDRAQSSPIASNLSHRHEVERERKY